MSRNSKTTAQRQVSRSRTGYASPEDRCPQRWYAGRSRSSGRLQISLCIVPLLRVRLHSRTILIQIEQLKVEHEAIDPETPKERRQELVHRINLNHGNGGYL
jgi:hypothetical protein